MEKAELSEGIIVEIFITEPEDLIFIKENMRVLGLGMMVKVELHKGCTDCYNVQIMVESPTQLYLLGRYVGCDRKRILDLDF